MKKNECRASKRLKIATRRIHFISNCQKSWMLTPKNSWLWLFFLFSSDTIVFSVSFFNESLEIVIWIGWFFALRIIVPIRKIQLAQKQSKCSLNGSRVEKGKYLFEPIWTQTEIKRVWIYMRRILCIACIFGCQTDGEFLFRN